MHWAIFSSDWASVWAAFFIFAFGHFGVCTHNDGVCLAQGSAPFQSRAPCGKKDEKDGEILQAVRIDSLKRHQVGEKMVGIFFET
jgi:hypothetical protein